MIYGYARVSTAAQDLDGQLAQLRAAGCGRVFREKITGTHAERPQLKRMLGVLAPGDLVVTPAVDRISRDTTDLLVIARVIERAGAGLRSLAEPVVDTTRTSRRWCSPCWGSRRSWSVAASSSGRRAVASTRRPRA